ncbi:Gfo/Idh/MocA family protein [Alicyclobacillus fodiniaquatilis]|uniref:Gfo/Idh/MocA family protein n=1 Tax=Alicyclobacillus fodiniaquatilis TaxID=1661150 RepID=A0ABW4JJF1_9BACL
MFALANIISFGIVGGASFRAQYFLRIARALPERFRVCGMVVRNEEKGTALQEAWGVPTFRTIDEMLARERPLFVVVSVGVQYCADIILQLAQARIPVLSETPPAADLNQLTALYEQIVVLGAKVQVAEQYHLHPMHSARIGMIQSGWLGKVSQVTVSISHMYHAVSLMRKYLDVKFENATIRAMRFHTSIVLGPTREGPPTEDKIIPSTRDLAWIQFRDKLALYDFEQNQHRSWVRTNHLAVRGDRGEIFDTHLNVLQDVSTPLHLDLKRIHKGEMENQEGHYLEGVIAGERWVYRNPFAPGRLYDDEIAIATCLQKMADYVDGGPSFYGLPEAAQDHYIGLMIEQAIATGSTVTTVQQAWAAEGLCINIIK